MNASPRAALDAVFPLLIMLLLAMLTLWLNRTVELIGTTPTRAPTHEADYVVDNFNLLRLGPEGDARYLLSAARMVHFPDDDTSHLTAPSLMQTAAGKPVTRASAERGLVSTDGREVKLYGNVELFRSGTGGPGNRSEDIRVRSAYLRVIPDDDKADTHERVVIEQGASVLSGTGMSFDNRYRSIVLHARVRALLERKK